MTSLPRKESRTSAKSAPYTRANDCKEMLYCATSPRCMMETRGRIRLSHHLPSKRASSRGPPSRSTSNSLKGSKLVRSCLPRSNSRAETSCRNGCMRTSLRSIKLHWSSFVKRTMNELMQNATKTIYTNSLCRIGNARSAMVRLTKVISNNK